MSSASPLPPPSALGKRYAKLLAKVQQWRPSGESDPLSASHAALLSSSSALPPPASVSDGDTAVDAFLKDVEQFMRALQVSQGLGKAADAPETKKQHGGGGGGHKAGGAEAAAADGEKAAKPAKVAHPKKDKKTAAAAADGALDERKEAMEESKANDAILPAGDAKLPEWMQHRVDVWDRIAAAASAQRSSIAPSPITVQLPDGRTLPGVAGVTTPYDIGRQLAPNSVDRFLLAKVDERTWDLYRPLEADCSLVLLDFDSKEGAHTFWHSSAHVLGQAVEREFSNVRLCVGPPLDDGGFYYDVEMGEQKVSPADFPRLEKVVERIAREKQPFTRLELAKEEALDMFKYNPFKQEIIRSKVPDGARCTAYRCGNLIDLCKGPHLPNTSYIKALAVTKSSSAYWMAKADAASLQRVYGISFPDKKRLKEWEAFMRAAEERDHRKVGLQQRLFFFHELSPGSCFFLPHGARVYNRLVQFIRDEYAKRGYSEVISPNVFNVQLWKTSGHYQNYKENMFIFDVEGQEFALKPMSQPLSAANIRSAAQRSAARSLLQLLQVARPPSPVPERSPSHFAALCVVQTVPVIV